MVTCAVAQAESRLACSPPREGRLRPLVSVARKRRRWRGRSASGPVLTVPSKMQPKCSASQRCAKSDHNHSLGGQPRAHTAARRTRLARNRLPSGNE